MRPIDSWDELPPPRAEERPDAPRAAPHPGDESASGPCEAREPPADGERDDGSPRTCVPHESPSAARAAHGAVEREIDPLVGARARSAWRAARSFADLLELGAGFLDGRVRHFPGWGAPQTDEETDAIRARLLGLNARGFLSVASQPGFDARRAGRHVRQRAFVAGFAPRALAQRLVGPARIDVRAWHPDGTTSARAGSPVEAATLEDGVARVLVGHAARDVELELFEDDLAPDARAALRATSYVVAFDPEFGRADELWTELDRLGRG